MRFNKLDMNLLVVLDALLNECSVSRAAERVFLSTSATSNALARLREYFDDELLVQVGRRMELTPRAQALREPVRDILTRVEATVATQPTFDPATSTREFRIFASEYTQLTLGRHLFALAHEQACTATIHFVQQSPHTQRELERGEADLLIIPQRMTSPDHPTHVLFEDELVCLMWSGSAMAGSTLTRERYFGCSHVVMVPPGLPDGSLEAIGMREQGLSRKVGATTFSIAALPSLLVGTDMLALSFRRLARQAVQTLPLVMQASPGALPKLRQTMQWHKYRSNDPGVIWLRELVLKAVDRMNAEPQA